MSRQLLAAAALCPGRCVEADGGGRGQVETLGPAVDRHPHRDVGQIAYVLRKSPGLVAEQPCGRVREHRGRRCHRRPGPVVRRSGSPRSGRPRPARPRRRRGTDCRHSRGRPSGCTDRPSRRRRRRLPHRRRRRTAAPSRRCRDRGCRHRPREVAGVLRAGSAGGRRRSRSERRRLADGRSGSAPPRSQRRPSARRRRPDRPAPAGRHVAPTRRDRRRPRGRRRRPQEPRGPPAAPRRRTRPACAETTGRRAAVGCGVRAPTGR
jgi:hypothetical protein